MIARTGMTVLDPTIHVGGMTDFANGSGAVPVRAGEGKQYGVRRRDLMGLAKSTPSSNCWRAT